MDFSEVDMPKILRSGLSTKFQDFDPFDFEDFIAQLFRDNGFHVKQTPRTGDYGADLIIEKDNEKTAVQVKRFSNRVGVKHINDIVAAKSFYRCTKALVITTSSYTKQAKQMGKNTSTVLWSWSDLQRYVCDTYLEGKDHYSYFGSSTTMTSEHQDIGYCIPKVEYNRFLGGGLHTVVHIQATNQSNKNIRVGVGMPTYITSEYKQIEAANYITGCFTGGVIYAGCSVTLSFAFESEQLPIVREGERIIIRRYDDNEKLIECDHTIKRTFPHPPTKSACYVVTMCFGKGSKEYVEMIAFRDRFLCSQPLGRLFVRAYYRFSKPLSSRLEHHRLARVISRYLLKIILVFVRVWCRITDKVEIRSTRTI